MSREFQLRKDLIVESPNQPDGEWIFRDPITHHVHKLNALGAFLAQHMDGTRDLQSLQLLAQKHFDQVIPLEEIQAFVQNLRLRLLLEEEEIRIQLDRAKAVIDAENRAKLGMMGLYYGDLLQPKVKIQMRPGLRYECLNCGVCCSGRFHVELTQSDREVLAHLDWSKLPWSLEQVIEKKHVAGDAEDKARYFLRQVNGHCILLKHHRCLLHEAFGYESKPLGCRIFPFYPIMTPQGPVIQYRPECSMQYQSRFKGPEVAKDKIWKEIAKGFKSIPQIPSQFFWTLNPPMDIRYEDYKGLEDYWIQIIQEQGWKACLTQMSKIFSQQGPPPAQPMRAFQDLLGGLSDYIETSLSLKRKGHLSAFASIYPKDLSHDPQLWDLLLLNLGLVRDPDQLSDWVEIQMGMKALRPTLEQDLFQRLIDEYLLDFLVGKYLFWGLSMASGLGLMRLILYAWRETALYAAVVYGRPLKASLFNEAQIAWHLLLFSQDSMRAYLLTRHRDALEALVYLQPF